MTSLASLLSSSSSISPPAPPSRTNVTNPQNHFHTIETFLEGQWNLQPSGVHDDGSASDSNATVTSLRTTPPRASSSSGRSSKTSSSTTHQSLHFQTKPTQLLKMTASLPSGATTMTSRGAARSRVSSGGVSNNSSSSTFVPWKASLLSLLQEEFSDIMLQRATGDSSAKKEHSAEWFREMWKKDKECLLEIGMDQRKRSSSSSSASSHTKFTSVPLKLLPHQKYSLFDSIVLKQTNGREKRFNVGRLRCKLREHTPHCLEVSFFHGRFQPGDMICVYCGFYRSFIKRYQVTKHEGTIKINLKAFRKFLGPIFCKYVHQKKVIGVSNAIFHGPPIKLDCFYSGPERQSLQVSWCFDERRKQNVTYIPEDFDISKSNPWIGVFAKDAPNYYNLSHSYLQYQYLSPSTGTTSGHVVFSNVPSEAHEVRLFLEGYFDAANCIIRKDSQQLDALCQERNDILESVIGRLDYNIKESPLAKLEASLEESQQEKKQLEEKVKLLSTELNQVKARLQEQKLLSVPSRTSSSQPNNSDSVSKDASKRKMALSQEMLGNLTPNISSEQQHIIASLQEQLKEKMEDLKIKDTQIAELKQYNTLHQERAEEMQEHLNKVIVEKKTLEDELERLLGDIEERSIDSWSTISRPTTEPTVAGEISNIGAPQTQTTSHSHRNSSQSRRLRKGFTKLLSRRLRLKKKSNNDDTFTTYSTDDAISVNSDALSIAPMRM